ncbi:MAG: alpha-glucosidase, partial [Kamptonema sp. SIO4C4]|nr:alpha-glucosidase [Kamptonema sp. SIO4C4]
YDKNLPKNHQILREMRQIIDEYEDKVLIGETFIDNSLHESITFYGVYNDELHLPFAFEFPFSPWYPGYLQRQIEKQELLTPPGAWPNYFIDNHDIPRHLSRWITCTMCTEPVRVAKAAATLLLTLRGTPFLYYGQEIGMVNHLDIPPDKLRDKAVVLSDTGEVPPPRDGGRTPMQWDTSAYAGFSFGQEVDPWLPIHDNYQEVNVATELADENSILNFYRRVIQVRRNSEALLWGKWKPLIHYPDEQLAYLRATENEQVVIILNFGYQQPLQLDEPLEYGNWCVLLSERFEAGKVIDLPEMLEAFEILIVQRI